MPVRIILINSYPINSIVVINVKKKVKNVTRFYPQNKQESCAIAKMTAQCALYMGAMKIFGTP